MNIKVNAVKFSPTKELESFVNSKLKKLMHFYDEIISIEVFLKLDTKHKTKNKITEIKLEIPGNGLFAKKQSDTFEESTDSAVEALKRQITKRKEKLRGV
jgi:putative sigma-54 modulation protein